jgi:hypothetical protein
MRWRRGEGRKTGGIKAASKPFLQAFPNLGCFRPRISKDSFGGFLGFQWVTRGKNPKCVPSKFFRHARLFSATFHYRAPFHCFTTGWARGRTAVSVQACSWWRSHPVSENCERSTNSDSEKVNCPSIRAQAAPLARDDNVICSRVLMATLSVDETHCASSATASKPKPSRLSRSRRALVWIASLCSR